MSDDTRLLARTRWRLTGQFAAVITGVVLLVGGLAWAMMARGQHTDGRRELAGSLATASVSHPWPCVWMFEWRDGRLARTPAAPASLPFRGDLGAVSRHDPVLVTEHRVGGIDYLVRTEWHPGRVAQAALDLRYQAEERQRLYLALVVAEVAGLAAALLIGRVLSGRAMRPLTDALARQRQFVADASHELRTPLTQVHTRAQLLQRRLHGGTDPRALAGDAERLVDGSRQFVEVLDDLLLAAELGATARDRTPVDLAAVAAEVAAAEEARLRRNGLELRVRDDGGRYLVAGAEPALRRVVNALVDNAIGHTPAGGHIRLELTAEAGTVALTVADDGVGLPDDSRRLFDRFAHGTHGTGRRFGLGLALTREIVTHHGGTITASGAPGAGATFRVQLPAAVAGSEPSRPVRSAQPV